VASAARWLSGSVSSGSASKLPAERPAGLAFVSGGWGLWSTVDDNVALAGAFLGDGAVDGVRLLRPATLALMTTNHWSASQRASAVRLGLPLFSAHGFGLGVAVVLDPTWASAVRCRGGVGGHGRAAIIHWHNQE
jgi:hypothetical protein